MDKREQGKQEKPVLQPPSEEREYPPPYVPVYPSLANLRQGEGQAEGESDSDKNLQDSEGQVRSGERLFTHQPFSTTDLLNRKQHTPSYTEKPQAITDLMQSIFSTHKPTWAGCQELLVTQATLQYLERNVPAGIADACLYPKEHYLVTDPQYDPNEAEGLQCLDISGKLQKLERFEGMTATQLIQVAHKLFTNQEEEAKKEARKEADQKLKQKADLRAAAFTARGAAAKKGHSCGQVRERGLTREDFENQPKLEKDQCVICKKEHWKNECPEREVGDSNESQKKTQNQKANHCTLHDQDANPIGLAGAECYED
ncbi:hypothetical protein AAY473_023869 [Plecturocebus cupreus]